MGGRGSRKFQTDNTGENGSSVIVSAVHVGKAER